MRARIPGWAYGHDRTALALVLGLHLAATCLFFAPTEVLEDRPLYGVDHPIHTHRVYVYREGLRESGVPWGVDPEVSAGSITNPGQDVGAKPQQVLGMLLGFSSASTVVRLFLFVVVLTFPLWVLLACRRIGLPLETQVWILVTLLVLAWLDQRLSGYFHWGLVSFVAASYCSIYVLALFLGFLERPRWRSYLALCLSSSLLFLLHLLGPVVVGIPMALYTLAARPLRLAWRGALAGVPLVVAGLNAFWLVPFLYAQHIPQPAWFAPVYPPGTPFHLRHGQWSELLDRLDPSALGPLAIGLALAAYGGVVLDRTVGRRVAVSLGLCCGLCLFLTYLGSFLPVTSRMQPIRFLVPAFAFMTVLVGTALATLAGRLRLPVATSAAATALGMALIGALLGRPTPLALPPEPDPLAAFVTSRTEPADRLLIQSPDGYRFGDYETKVFPLAFDREVIGSNFPVVYDRAQFLDTVLFGRAVEAWSPQELPAALHRWGITWALTVTPEARALFASAFGAPVERVDRYDVFRVADTSSRFLVGTGTVVASVNRLELSGLKPERGRIVLRYRYHPGWRATPEIPIRRHPLPEDRSGFIALEDPPESLTLRFDPWGMLRARWPDP